MQKQLLSGVLAACLALAGVNGWTQAPKNSKPASADVSSSEYPRVSPGTAEAGTCTSVKATRASFDKAGIHYSYVEYLGLSHEWQVWRKSLNDFAPLLFQWSDERKR